MSKRIVSIAIVAAFALIGGWNIYQNQSKNELNLTELTLSNVEALARGEGPGPDWGHHKLVNKGGRQCCEDYWPHNECSGAYYPCD